MSLERSDRAWRTGQRPDEFIRRGEAVRPDDPATIVYTSGTSANPKGAVYTHRALITQGHQFFAFPELTERMIFRSVVHLPLNHLYERANTPQGMLVKGIVPHFRDEAERFLETLYEVAPAASRFGAALLVEARLARHRRRRESAGEARAYRAAMQVGQAYRRRRWNGERRCAGCALRARPLAMFNRMLKKIGLHRVRIALSAGAPLPGEVQAFWQVWGVNLKNLYGQTEGGVVTAQFDPFPQPGSVGRAVPGQ